MKNYNLKVSFLSLLLLMSVSVQAQQKLFDTHLFKVNLLPIALRSYNISYETTISDHWSFALGVNVRPSQGVPFQSEVERYYTDNDVRLSNLMVSQYSIVPEFRYYFTPSSALRGFYLGTYFQYANFGVDMQIDYTGRGNGVNPSEFDFKGPIHTYTAGASIGRQWRFGKAFYLDWTILGASFGINSGNIVGINRNNRPLDDYEQQVFINKPNEFDIPLANVRVDAESDQISIRTNGLWAGARFGLSIGYRF
ncbi:DUF3575 domain-containing protein [Sphingobacterium populi]|nr:DUF3575 domain-containing protein [Sphingobacterium sp. CFCC 11742]